MLIKAKRHVPMATYGNYKYYTTQANVQPSAGVMLIEN